MLAEVDRLMSGATSCGQGSILLSAGGGGGAFLVERWLLWAFGFGNRPFVVRKS